jgi:hypothetical protein
MKKIGEILFVFLLLTSCSPSPEALATQAAEAWTPTPEATATPIPAPITGKMFWDANGSGLQDETSFIVPEFEMEDLPYFFELLSVQETDITAFVSGKLVTVPEPDIPGMKVCAGFECVETDKSGEFTLQPLKQQNSYKLKFYDPNQGDPEKEFRYINKWNGYVVKESYEVNGVIVPEQHLFDTEVLKMIEENEFLSDSINNFGLMQGYYTFPFEIGSKPIVSNYVDMDKTMCPKGSDPHFCDDVRDWQGGTITYDDHTGKDYRINTGTHVLSASPGEVSKVGFTDSRGNYLLIDTTFSFQDSYNHAFQLFLNEGELIFRGQILLSVGSTGNSSHPHLHFEIK